MADKTLGNEEMTSLLTHHAKEQQIGDNFRVKVKRLGGSQGFLAGAPQHVCTLKDAMIVHLANPETWIPPLLGGGTYALTVYPGDSMTQIIGNDIRFQYTGVPAKDLDFDAITKADWSGPGAIIWPPRPGAPLLPSLVSMAPQAQTQVTAPQTMLPGASVSGGQLGSFGTVGQQNFSAEFQLLEQQRRELAEQAMRIREEALKKETELTFAKMRADLEAERARWKAEAEAAKAAVIAPKQPSVLEQLIPALAPVLTAMMQQSQETRMMMMKQSELAQQQQQNMMQLILAKPSVDPLMLSLIEKMNAKPASDTSTVEMMHSITDTMGSMTRLTMDALASAAELGGGQQKENVPMMLVKEIARVVEHFGTMGSNALRSRAPLPQRPVQIRPLPGSPAAQGAGALAMGQQVPMNGGVAQGNGQLNGMPPNGSSGPQQQNPLAVPPPSGTYQGPAFQRTQNGDMIFNSVPDALEYQLRMRNPAPTVVTFLMNNIQDPTLQAEYTQAGGMVQLLERRLGDWLRADPINYPYVQGFMRLIQDALRAKGLIPDEEGEESETGTEPEDAQYEESETESAGDPSQDEIAPA